VTKGAQGEKVNGGEKMNGEDDSCRKKGEKGHYPRGEKWIKKKESDLHVAQSAKKFRAGLGEGVNWVIDLASRRRKSDRMPGKDRATHCYTLEWVTRR